MMAVFDCALTIETREKTDLRESVETSGPFVRLQVTHVCCHSPVPG